MIKRMTEKLKKTDTETTTANMMQHWIKLNEAAEERWRTAELVTKDAQIELLEAQLCERDAESAVLHLLVENALARCENALAR